MLDKSAFKVLGIIASMSIEGENLVVDKREILSMIEEDMTVEELDSNMEALEVNDMISIRFSDANLYCVALRPKGKLVAEKNHQAELAAAQIEEEKPEAVIDDLVTTEPVPEKLPLGIKKLILICAGSSFVGSFIAAIIAFLIVRFS